MTEENKTNTATGELGVVIYTPDGIKTDTQAEHVVVPAEEGDFMILPGHCGLVANLRTGILEVHGPDGVRYYSIHGGSFSVEGDKVRISTFATEDAENLDIERARRAKQHAEAILASEAEEHIIAEARAALYRAIIRLEAYELVDHS